ncbi:hypothetical protein NJ7G_3682 [Natrinema sp. J7-2]|nr:hypothetical protein NJ7G_3682 [Natrinema sp. J7-2]
MKNALRPVSARVSRIVACRIVVGDSAETLPITVEPRSR